MLYFFYILFISLFLLYPLSYRHFWRHITTLAIVALRPFYVIRAIVLIFTFHFRRATASE